MPTLQRRTFLKSSGVALALPMLEAMNPAIGAEPAVGPKRLVFMCTTLGLYPRNLWPEKTGKDYESTPYLDLLKSHRDDFTLFSGLEHEDQNGRQPHDSEKTWLTAARKPGMGGFRNTVSVDQIAATAMRNVTRYPSITLGTMNQQSQSYTNGGVMIPAETSPATVFARLFLEGNAEEVRRQKQRLSDGRSILDQLGSEMKKVRKKASRSDNHLLDDYFESIRQTESNIAEAQSWMKKPKPKVDAKQPADINDPADIIGRAKLLVDLVPLMVQTDSTRVISVMIQDHYVVPKVEGVTGNHHNLSHHGQDESKIDQLEKIEREIVGCFGNLMGQLKSKSETESRLLDNTAILFGSNLGNANAHDTKNLPTFLAGGGFKHQGYQRLKDGTPLCNLFMSMLHNAGLETGQFAQSTGSLSW